VHETLHPGNNREITKKGISPGIFGGARVLIFCCYAMNVIAVRCEQVQCVAVSYSVLQSFDVRICVCCHVLQCTAACCSVLQCVAVCCSVLQRAEVCCWVLCKHLICTIYPSSVIYKYVRVKHNNS